MTLNASQWLGMFKNYTDNSWWEEFDEPET